MLKVWCSLLSVVLDSGFGFGCVISYSCVVFLSFLSVYDVCDIDGFYIMGLR